MNSSSLSISDVSSSSISTLHYITSINKRIKNIYIGTELVLPVYNEHPYFPLKIQAKKVCMIHGKIQYNVY